MEALPLEVIVISILITSSLDCVVILFGENQGCRSLVADLKGSDSPYLKPFYVILFVV